MKFRKKKINKQCSHLKNVESKTMKKIANLTIVKPSEYS